MLGKRSRPIQRKQSKFPLMSSDNAESLYHQSGVNKSKAFFNSPRLFIGFNSKKLVLPEVDLSGGTRSPTSPLDYNNNQHHKSPRGFDQGVGLGILAALHSTETKTALLSPKSSETRIPAKPSGKPSQPIPIGSPRPLREEERPAMEYSESYTCITSHGPKTTIRQIFDDPSEAEIRSSKCCQPAVFEASCCCYSDAPDLPAEDFLSVCYLCRRQLRHGKDIYMYRGDRAFCSVECRYQQIVSDEKERCSSMSMKRAASPKSSRCYPTESLERVEDTEKKYENLRSDVRENGGAVYQNGEIGNNLEEDDFQRGETNGEGNEGENGYDEREMKELADILSKLNPMAEEFVPHSLANGVSGPKKNGGSNGNVRRRNGYNQARRRTNSRISRAQREESIRKTVYVSDIDQLVTEEQLAALFTNCGQVVDCRVCGDPNSVLRFAFVEFIDEDSARRALGLSGTVLGFYPLRVLPSKTAILPVNPTFLPASEDERELCARTIYCTNIDKKVSQADVKLFFETLCGPVSRLRLLGDYQHLTRISFVEFVYAESAMAALNCSGAILGSLPIRVSPSKTPVRPRNPRPLMH